MTLRSFVVENHCPVEPDDAPLSGGYGSHIGAALRLMGFLGLSLAVIPVHIFYNTFRSDNANKITPLFYSLLLRIIGFRLRVHGTLAGTKPTLFIANHTSYLDIPVLGALLPASFVAKSDVAAWPFFGFMAKLQRTIFIERQAGRASDQSNQLRDLLAKGRSLILFPEGTSSDGQSVLPFKSSLFSVAEEAGRDIALAIQPISVACTEMNGLPMTRTFRSFYTWYGDMTLVGHLWAAFRFGHFTIDVIFHPPVSPTEFPNRKALAAYCQQQVARGIEQCVTGRKADSLPPQRLSAPR